MDQTTRNIAAAGRNGKFDSELWLSAHVQVKTTHGASNPSQLGKNHQRKDSVGSREGFVSATIRHHPIHAEILGTKTKPPTTADVIASTSTAAEPQSLACLRSGCFSS